MNTANIEYINLEELSTVDYKIISGEADITGWPVRDESGADIGKVRDLLFDPEQKAIRYIILDLNETISGPTEKAVLIPIAFANLGEDKKEVVLPVMHQSQFDQLPQYIIGELTRETEMKIRSAIGSPAALRIEEEIVELDHKQFYQHHHFDRGNQSVIDHEKPLMEKPEPALAVHREEEIDTVHNLISHAEAKPLHSEESETTQANRTEQFEVETHEGRFTIAPQENGTYRILDGERKVGVIYAEASDDNVQWRTMDELGNRFVTMIGEAITAHNASTAQD